MRKLFSIIPEKGKIINKIHIIGNKETIKLLYCINAFFERRCTFNGPPQ